MRKPLERNWRIDFLRGIAILSVLILHFHLSYNLDNSLVRSVFSADFIKTVAGNGNYGVTMFFVISGFLITTNTLNRYKEFRNINILEFYVYRAARIIPCLLLALAIITIFNFLKIPIFENRVDSTSLFVAILSVLTFWHNALMAKIGYFNYCLNIYWSLSVEEVFYIAFPILCVFLKKLKFILLFCFLLIVIAPIYRYLNQTNEIVALYGNFSCFDAIALGCCASLVSRKINLKDRIIKFLEYSGWLLIVAIYFSGSIMPHVVYNMSLMALGTAVLLIVASIKSTTNPNLFFKAIGWFGKGSYEIYLFHIIILALMKSTYPASAFNSNTKIVWFCCFVAASAATAWFISKFFSIPLNKRIRLLTCKHKDKSQVNLKNPINLELM